MIQSVDLNVAVVVQREVGDGGEEDNEAGEDILGLYGDEVAHDHSSEDDSEYCGESPI